MATRDLSKVTSGPCKVTLDGVDVGHTEEGVEFVLSPHFRERYDERYGATIVDLIHTGDTCEIRMKLTQWELANIKAVYGPALDGTLYAGFGRKPGAKYSSYAKQMVLHPLEEAGADYDVTIWKAVPASPVAIGYNNEGDRVFEVAFIALADTAKADGMVLGKIGSPI